MCCLKAQLKHFEACHAKYVLHRVPQRTRQTPFELDSQRTTCYYLVFFNLGWIFPGQNSDPRSAMQAPEVTQPFVEQHSQRQELVRKRSKVNSWPIHDPCVAEGRGLQRFLSRSCTTVQNGSDMIEVIPWDPAVKGTALRAFVLLASDYSICKADRQDWPLRKRTTNYTGSVFFDDFSI